MALDRPSWGLFINRSIYGEIPNIRFCIYFLSFAVPFYIFYDLKSDSRNIKRQYKLF